MIYSMENEKYPVRMSFEMLTPQLRKLFKLNDLIQ